ncbi:hypothetical protein B0H63DRAFT_14431 [Podospora didyma]|uniref:Uncharacterized protein n=1 Tax=Podospora didyma TaxID=330526 RepID=A0AAE0P4H9_9PEZI|nr:hypothetical protein B0H63DRAFT_14431 [Podospora didyma]
MGSPNSISQQQQHHHHHSRDEKKDQTTQQDYYGPTLKPGPMTGRNPQISPSNYETDYYSSPEHSPSRIASMYVSMDMYTPGVMPPATPGMPRIRYSHYSQHSRHNHPPEGGGNHNDHRSRGSFESVPVTPIPPKKGTGPDVGSLGINPELLNRIKESLAPKPRASQLEVPKRSLEVPRDAAVEPTRTPVSGWWSNIFSSKADDDSRSRAGA